MKYLVSTLLLLIVASPLTAQRACDPAVLLADIQDRLLDVRAGIAAGAAATGLVAQIDQISAAIDSCAAVSSPQPTATAAASRTIYILGSSGVNVRAEPSTTATILGSARGGSSLPAYGLVPGQAVSGSANWYQVDYNGGIGYVHSSLASTNPPPTPRPAAVNPPQRAPAAQPQPTQAPAQVQQQNFPRPRNCATAVSYGLGAAEIAQRWPHLDRDKDGVACYGD